MRVVIVGGGLSGLSLATFLRRLNIDCVILEQAPYLAADYVPPYSLYANALSCYKAYGVDHICSDALGGSEPLFGIRNSGGKWLWKVHNRNVKLRALHSGDVIPLSTAPTANSSSIVSERLREDHMQDIGIVPLRTTIESTRLRHALRQGVAEVKYGCRAVDLVPHDGVKGGVHVVLEDGRTEWGDIVVGADGMHSTIRKLLYPEEHIGTSDAVLGSTHLDGYVDVEHCPPELQHQEERWGLQRTLGWVPLYRQGENRIAFTATMFTLPSEVVPGEDQVSPKDMCDAFRQLLRREFSSFGVQIASLLGSATVVSRTEAIEVPVMPQWYNKRAVLIGDAAHGAMPSFLAQDASLCVEDAAVLATALLEVPLMRDSGFEYCFRLYESVRRDRVERYIRQSRRARRFTATRYIGARDGVLTCAPPLLLNAAQRWLSRWSFSAQEIEVDPKIKMETAYRS